MLYEGNVDEMLFGGQQRCPVSQKTLDPSQSKVMKATILFRLAKHIWQIESNRKHLIKIACPLCFGGSPMLRTHGPVTAIEASQGPYETLT